MRILGIESSCDETAASVVEDGNTLLSSVVQSQISIHAEYGGVIPEIAARSHIEAINPVVKKALVDAGCTWDDIAAIAVTYAPGLVGSLLVGSLAARTLAIIHDKPLYKIHHVEAHVYANFITSQQPSGEVSANKTQDSSVEPTSTALFEGDVPARASQTPRAEQSSPVEWPLKNGAVGGGELKLPAKQPAFPMLALIVSGGHSQLVVFRDHGDYQLVGQTQDDAVGEAFDKVAKILGLPYPGGPAIAEAAQTGDPQRYKLPIAKLAGKYDFSFSGLKTAVLRAVQHETGNDYTFASHRLAELLTSQQVADFAASFQYTAIKTLVAKARRAYDDFSPASVVIAGGVAANLELRRQLTEALPIDIEYAPISLCTDNAAMVASLGFYQASQRPADDPYDVEVVPRLSMTTTNWSNV